ncbi:DTW domain-containing protein [Oligoflexaceae bacterium]|nr:DTW domain-containing protein [Oligoflexaceae bacterium]
MNSRIVCHNCQNAQNLCLCELLRPFHTQTHWTFLAHPRENRRKTRTGVWAHRFLQNSRYKVAAEFLEDKSSERKQFLLFPGEDAVSTRDFSANAAQKSNMDIVVIEGTWSQANKILNESDDLQRLPRITLDKKYRSNFKIRKQPREECLSSIEAVAYALKELGDIRSADQKAMLSLFETMVQRQIDSQNQWNPNHFQKWVGEGLDSRV